MSQYQRKRSTGGSQAYSRPPSLSAHPSRQDLKTSRLRVDVDSSSLHHEALDKVFGFEPLEGSQPRTGWLVNMVPVTTKHESSIRSALELYFLDADGSRFQATILYEPYFYVLTKDATACKQIKSDLERRFSSELHKCEEVSLDDLQQSNHLSGLKRVCLKLSFRNQTEMNGVRRQLLPIVSRNKAGQRASDAYSTDTGGSGFFEGGYKTAGTAVAAAVQATRRRHADPFADIVDLREHDVPYYQRVCIDLRVFAGSWYQVAPHPVSGAVCTKLEILEKSQPVVLAFDIECTKQPLKFPDAKYDKIYMISYMVDGEGFLITNRQVVSADVADFDFTPKPEFPGPFCVRNVPDEKALIEAFFAHVRQVRPSIFVTYNGDFFDWPFLEQRAKEHGIDMAAEIGIAMVAPPQPFGGGGGGSKPAPGAAAESSDSSDDEDDDKPRGGEYRGRNAVHIDCLYWVKRDSYLPAGSRGLKAVTKAKLGYDPIEIDPEDMERQAKENPDLMASYSVSDAVSTYYLYDKYIHLFIFSLCTIIPMGPEDVLRKGSGTLCESLLMVEAFAKGILCPNKQNETPEKFYQGHLLEQETYVGGHVECLESGVFRADLPCSFTLDSTAFDELRANIDRDLHFAIQVEGKLDVADCTNYDDIKSQILARLEDLALQPKRTEPPKIYHLDVGAMYPNIILTNRLQPIAIVDDVTCSACVHNRPESDCKREMPWEWRGDMYPATRSEYRQILSQLEMEMVEGVMFRDLPLAERKRLSRARLKEYSSKSYKRVKDTVTEERTATVCMRENPFYVDTIRAFRDRRNEYKAHTKRWANAKKKATDAVDKAEAETKVVLYDSLQLAHKCILNSFYGYVMRKGARWHSMEMAAIVTRTGADLIKQARRLVERVGKPLELDTDGIWCVLPASFPDTFCFEFGAKQHQISYPCVMLNADVHAQFTNPQYQDLEAGRYVKRAECTIFFEVDGPYRCMVLPASQEEGKLLKKRYAVFNNNGTLAELKGFEMKRRGELKIIKTFQSQVFERFLCGSTLEECYAAVAEIADSWLDILVTKGASLTDAEVIELISENRSMSRALAEYGDQKSTAITTARRLAEFLGHGMTRDKGLACQLLIARKPYGAPTTERAIPTAIFSADPGVRDACLRRWLKEPSMPGNPDVRSVIDWDYYLDRLGKAVQKIITIPAALQRVDNPVPRVKHPEWLARLVREKYDSFKQVKLDGFFAAAAPQSAPSEEDEMPPSSPLAGEPEQAAAAVAAAPAGSHQWLLARKAFWRSRRKNKRSRGAHEEPSTAKPKDLMSFASGAREAASGDVLEVIELRALAEEPGVFQMFAIGQSGLVRQLRVSVPRQLYMECSSQQDEDDEPPPAGVTRRRVQGMHLPHGNPQRGAQHALYQLEMDEALFVKRPKELAQFLERACVVGLYETQVPLAFRAVVQLGNTVKLARPGALLDEELPLSALAQAELPPGKQYLDGDHRRVLVFHAGRGDRQVAAMFLVHDAEQGEYPRSVSATVWLSGGPADDKISLERLLRDEAKAAGLGEDDCRFAQPPRVVTLHGPQACWDALQAALTDVCAARTRDSVLVLAQCGVAKTDLLSLCTCLRDVPVVELAPDFSDFPALQWRRFGCRRAVHSLLKHAKWFRSHLEGARFAKVPVAMIGNDWALGLSDVCFARNLVHNKMVLWASVSGTPDLGGNEKDMGVEILMGECENPTVALPGAYRSVCAQVKMDHLAVNAVLQADLVNELDFSGDGMALTQSLAADGETTRAFRVLKGMMALWYEAAVNDGSVLADALLTGVYRWLASSKSMMHDPSLHRHVHSLMKKLFLQLLSQVRLLGGVVVSANFVSLTINTCKLDLGTGKAFIEHFRRTMHGKALFANISLIPIRFWNVFLFLDACNYGGVLEDDQISHEWNIARYLPEHLVQPFEYLVAMFAFKPNKHRDSTAKWLVEAHRKTSLVLEDDENDGRTVEEKLREAETSYVQELVGEHMAKKLIKEMPALMEKNNGPDDFPKLPGSYLPLRNAALEFTKSLCAVLSLDPAVEDQVRGLKRSLLKLLRTPEFAPEAEFRNPSLSLILPDVVCSACGVCEDLDMCRDPRLVRLDEDDAEERAPFAWACYRCEHAMDRRLIEGALVDAAQKRLLAYQVQDMVCAKCRTMRDDNTSEYCACSGAWTLTQSPASFRLSMQAFESVAKYHGFAWLREVCALVV